MISPCGGRPYWPYRCSAGKLEYLDNSVIREKSVIHVTKGAIRVIWEGLEFAAVVSAIQGAILIIGKTAVIGFLGAHEGYYVLPKVHSWHGEWRDTFINVKSGFTDIQII